MTFDPLIERPMSMAETAKAYRVSIRTARNWYMEGHLGIKLETILLGKSRKTSAEALRRFHEAVNATAAQQQKAA